jgi:hypothetical protein
MSNEIIAIEDTVDDVIVALMDSAADEFNLHQMTALPYLFSGMSPNQVSQAMTPALGEPITPENVRAWLGNSSYARLVSQGRSLMRGVKCKVYHTRDVQDATERDQALCRCPVDGGSC